MINVRNSILTVACFGLLSTAAMAMPAESMSDRGGDPATSTDPMKQSSPGMTSGSQDRLSIQGEILKVQGEMYTVQDASGKEVQLHVDESTQKSGKLKEGDQIEAEVTEEGHALSLKKAKGMN